MPTARTPALAVLTLLAACSDAGDGRSSASQTESAGSTLSGGSSSGSASDSGTTTGGGSVSDSMTSQPTSEPTTSTTSAASTADATATTDPGTTSSTGGSTDTTGPVVDTTSGSTGPSCTPAPEVCNDLDDDCNGITDDVDVGGDGICDCLSIALFGNKGSNPAAQFETWLEAQGTTVDRLQTDNVPLDQATLDKYDIVILDRLIRSYTPQEAALIQGWVGAGGGLMSMTGYTGGADDVNFPNSLIGPMGLTYNNSQGILNGPVTNWTPHPISDGITSVTFLGGFYIDIKNDVGGVNTTVAALPQGPVAVAQVRADGKLFIWGDEWIEFDSEWQNIPEIKKFWANILGWLAPQNFCVVPG